MKAYKAEWAWEVKLDSGQVPCDPYAISECLCPEHLDFMHFGVEIWGQELSITVYLGVF